MRLTKKLEKPYEKINGQDYVYTSETRLTKSFAQVEQKLGQLEDIEEELGIDLVTLFKAFKQGIWSKAEEYCDCLKDDPSFISPVDLELGIEDYLEYEKDPEISEASINENAPCLYTHIYEDVVCVVRVKDYGRSWALTKEELK